jgi:hypothetical protein
MTTLVPTGIDGETRLCSGLRSGRDREVETLSCRNHMENLAALERQVDSARGLRIQFQVRLLHPRATKFLPEGTAGFSMVVVEGQKDHPETIFGICDRRAEIEPAGARERMPQARLCGTRVARSERPAQRQGRDCLGRPRERPRRAPWCIMIPVAEIKALQAAWRLCDDVTSDNRGASTEPG